MFITEQLLKIDSLEDADYKTIMLRFLGGLNVLMGSFYLFFIICVSEKVFRSWTWYLLIKKISMYELTCCPNNPDLEYFVSQNNMQPFPD